jgi:hypothetical protein
VFSLHTSFAIFSDLTFLTGFFFGFLEWTRNERWGHSINQKFNQIESFFAICQTHPLPSPTQSNKSNKKANEKAPSQSSHH